MNRQRLLGGLGLAVLVTAVALASLQRRPRTTAAPLLPYQALAAELGPADQQLLRQIHAALRQAEQARAASGQWPAAFPAPGPSWTHLRHGQYVNYLGAHRQPGRLRWLVLVIEPAPAPLPDPVPPEDEEHHTLADGTGLHVSVWTAPDEGPLPEVVLPFPAAEGWTQRLRSEGRRPGD